MSKWTKRIAVFLVCLAMMTHMLPTVSQAVTVKPVAPLTVTHINPCYADVVNETDLAAPGLILMDDEDEYDTDMAEAAKKLRRQLEDWEQTASVKVVYEGEFTEEAMMALIGGIFDEALEHTGDPTEGDYLRWHYAGYGAGLGGYVIGGTYYLTLVYSVTYYTTEEQEEELEDAVDALLKELDLKKKTDYQKICAIYDWMTTNITYDYDNLNNTNYTLKYTAYAAMMNRTSVCQGYALLLYRLLLEAGVDCRMITGYAGEAHGWNIVQVNGEYYNVDATWDAVYAQAGQDYCYFMLCDETFGADHIRDAMYTTEDFYTAYPMAAADLDPDTFVDEDVCAHSFTNYISNNDATCEADGTKTAACDRGCGATDTVADEGTALGHSFTNYVSNGDAEEGSAGTKTAYCDHGCGCTDTVADDGGQNEITSQVYDVEDGQLLGVLPGMTVSQLLAALDQGSSVRVFDGQTELSGDDLVTGTVTLVLMDGETEVCSLRIVLLGDVSRDGNVDNLDAAAVLQYAAGWEVTADARLADVNGDGSVDNLDATVMLQYAAGWEVSFGTAQEE